MIRGLCLTASVAATLLTLAIPQAMPVAPHEESDRSGATPSWGVQAGTAKDDAFGRVALAGDAVYVAGETGGTFPGQTAPESNEDGDVFVRKYDAVGQLKWTRQISNSGADFVLGLTATSKGVLVFGAAWGALPGAEPAPPSGPTAFLRFYSPDGNVLWTKQFSTSQSAEDALLEDDAVYVTSSVRGTRESGGIDATLTKYDLGSGEQIWTTQIGSPKTDWFAGVQTGSNGELYVRGITNGSWPRAGGSNGSYDIVLLRINAGTGAVKWARQIGTSRADYSMDMVVDGSTIYLSGVTSGQFKGATTAGGQDAYLAAYQASGKRKWLRQFGTTGSDLAGPLVLVGTNVVVTGSTGGSMSAARQAADSDGYVRGYDARGKVLWTKQFGSEKDDGVYDVAFRKGSFFAVGATRGRLFGPFRGGFYDGFLTRFRRP